MFKREFFSNSNYVLVGKVSYGGQLLDEVVRGSERGEPDLLGELGEGRVGEERDVADQLVADV